MTLLQLSCQAKFRSLFEFSGEPDFVRMIRSSDELLLALFGAMDDDVLDRLSAALPQYRPTPAQKTRATLAGIDVERERIRFARLISRVRRRVG